MKVQISLKCGNTDLVLKCRIHIYPLNENEYIIVNPDCNRLIAEFAATITTIEFKLDLCCVSFSSNLHSPSSSYYAYPFHPFVWRLVSLHSNKEEEEEHLKRILQNRILFHNQCTNNIKKGIPSANRIFEKDIATFFYNNTDLFDLVSL